MGCVTMWPCGWLCCWLCSCLNGPARELMSWPQRADELAEAGWFAGGWLPLWLLVGGWQLAENHVHMQPASIPPPEAQVQRSGVFRCPGHDGRGYLRAPSPIPYFTLTSPSSSPSPLIRTSCVQSAHVGRVALLAAFFMFSCYRGPFFQWLGCAMGAGEWAVLGYSAAGTGACMYIGMSCLCVLSCAG